MHVGIANPRLRGKCSRHSRCIHNRQFCVSGKRPIYENLSPLITAWKPVRHQSTIWTNDNILSIGPLGAVVREYESKYKFDLRRCVRLCRLQKAGQFVQASLCEKRNIPGKLSPYHTCSCWCFVSLRRQGVNHQPYGIYWERQTGHSPSRGRLFTTCIMWVFINELISP